MNKVIKYLNNGDLYALSEFAVSIVNSRSVIMDCVLPNNRVQFFIKITFIDNAHNDAPNNEIELNKEINKQIIDANICDGFAQMIYSTTATLKVLLTDEQFNTMHTAPSLNNFNKVDIAMFHLMLNIKFNIHTNKYHAMIIENCGTSFGKFYFSMNEFDIKYQVFKSVMFQLIYSLYVLQQKFPGFAHNDLFERNVTLKNLYIEHEYGITSNNNNAGVAVYKQYTIHNKNYYVPFYGLVPKIIDFEASEAPMLFTQTEQIKDLLSPRAYTKLNDILDFFRDMRMFDSNNPCYELINKLDTSKLHHCVTNLNVDISKAPSLLDMLNSSVFGFDNPISSMQESMIIKKFKLD